MFGRDPGFSIHAWLTLVTLQHHCFHAPLGELHSEHEARYGNRLVSIYRAALRELTDMPPL